MNDDPQNWNSPPTTANAVIGRSLKYYYQNFFSLIVLCAVIFGPFMVPTRYLQNYLYSQALQDFLCQHLGSSAGIFFVSFTKLVFLSIVRGIESALFIATVIPNIVGNRQKEGAFFFRNILGMFRRFGSLITVSVLSEIAISFGFIFFVVPGLFLMVAFSVAIPVLMVEKTGPIQAMKKSWAYTAGRRGKIFLVMLSVGIIYVIVWYIFMKIGSAIYTVSAGYPCPRELSSLFGSIVSSPIIYVTTVFLYLYVKNKNPEPTNFGVGVIDGR